MTHLPLQTLSLPRRTPRYFLICAMSAALLLLQALTAAARGAPESFADLVDQVSPAVVNITTSTTVAGRSLPEGIVPPGSPFEDLFREFDNRNGPDRPRRTSALGSGFVISEDGYIVTNNHVIEKADQILIDFFNGEELPATVVGTDPNTDIALLKVETDKPLPFVSFADSDVARVGDWVLAVGNPLGQASSVSAGIISARNRALAGNYDDYIQTDAAINQGNSGGPLFNMDGGVIGVNTAILSPNGGSIGIGFSMASNVAIRVVGQLKEFGETRRGWLGVRIQNVSEDMVPAIEGLDSVRGALVSDVPPGPAAEAGLKAGDVILSFDGNDVSDADALVRQVGNAEVGKAVRVTVLRDGKTQTLKVTLGRREDAERGAGQKQSTPETAKEHRFPEFGLTMKSLDDQTRTQLDLPETAEGLVITDIQETSDAYVKGMRSGDVITEAAQQKLRNVEDFEAQISAARARGHTSILLLVRRGGDPRFVGLPLPAQ